MIEVLIGSTLSAMATALGAVPIVFMQRLAHKWRDFLLALTAGIMVSATTFSLIPTALEQGSLSAVTIGVILGMLALASLEKIVPHLDMDFKQHVIDERVFLILMALTLHNIPEGLSVGVSYAEGESAIGPLVAIAIGAQNFPEGFLIALFLIQQKVSHAKAIFIAGLTGSIEIVAGLVGFILSTQVDGLVPYGLSFAAGAMLFIVYKELIPESHGDGHATTATFGFIGGLLAMLYIIQIFG
ncbi:MAG: ZIP family metal transporter [Bacillaceae bacterium]